jgi:MoxR-like ATPase
MSANDYIHGNPAAPDGAGSTRPAWWIYQGTGRPRSSVDVAEVLPDPPDWRNFDGGPVLPPPDDDGKETARRLGVGGYLAEADVDPHEVDVVNAALYLRRPLLVTGKPGTGKSCLAYRIARELGLGPVLRWPITSRSVLRSGLYEYDPIGRAQAAGTRRAGAAPGDVITEPDIGDYLQLAPLGTALLPYRSPRVLLIDELDKSDIDLPNDLLNVFEEGEFHIPELVRVAKHQPEVSVLTADPGGTAVIRGGTVRCRAFPVVVITSNGEREFPAPFLRRTLRLELRDPDEALLASMVAAHFRDSKGSMGGQTAELIRTFLERSTRVGGLAADQLLNSVYLATSGAYVPDDESWTRLVDAIWRRLVDEPG